MKLSENRNTVIILAILIAALVASGATYLYMRIIPISVQAVRDADAAASSAEVAAASARKAAESTKETADSAATSAKETQQAAKDASNSSARRP